MKTLQRPWNPSMPPVHGRGFTLMEMLVTLVLVSFTTMLMFQMLGNYRVTRERVQSQAGLIDRKALFQAWFRDSVRGLYINNGIVFSGTAGDFRGTSLNPQYGDAGAPTQIEWRLIVEDGQGWILYWENGRERWRRPTERSRFAYLDEAGKAHDTWPPKLGKDDGPSLPAQVVLVREGEGAGPVVVGAVRGPLKPVVRAIGEGEI